MSDDIVARLRTVLPCYCDDEPVRWQIQAERYEAAGEIERWRELATYVCRHAPSIIIPDEIACKFPDPLPERMWEL